MDGVHVESTDGLHEDKPRLQALLRGADGSETPGNGAKELCKRIRAQPSRRSVGTSSSVEEVADYFRELNERYVSSEGSTRLHRQSLQRNATSTLASLSNPNQTS